ncbi:hypothetical protein Zmor_027880 [Zophobas morio]|uniref:Uncharacterized protein n=1 Tax=Zophobas morio TaxID=2755281 RepID=A0AA38HNX5_9CUCU|nr:hypothetical protein Zmor_027880 [Zophobas morio]
MDNSFSSRPALHLSPSVRISGASTSDTQPQPEHLLTPVAIVRSHVESIFSNLHKIKSRYPLQHWLRTINNTDLNAWGDVIEEMLLLIFPLEERAKKRKHAPGKSPLRTSFNRTQKRMVEYK